MEELYYAVLISSIKHLYNSRDSNIVYIIKKQHRCKDPHSKYALRASGEFWPSSWLCNYSGFEVQAITV